MKTIASIGVILMGMLVIGFIMSLLSIAYTLSAMVEFLTTIFSL